MVERLAADKGDFWTMMEGASRKVLGSGDAQIFMQALRKEHANVSKMVNLDSLEELVGSS